MPTEVQKAQDEVADLQAQLQQAYQASDAAATDRLINELSAAEKRRNRAIQRELTNYRSALPVREQVIRVLGMLGRPTAVSLLRDVAAARYGDVIAGPQLASLRRDEQRSWRSAATGSRAGGRPVYVVPALTYNALVLAMSSWPLELRLIVPTSPRVDMLHAIDRLAAELAETPVAPWAGEVERLLWQLASTVPGATGPAGDLEPATVRDAVEAELSQSARTDAADRAAAAKQASSDLNDEQQVWGRPNRPR